MGSGFSPGLFARRHYFRRLAGVLTGLPAFFGSRAQRGDQAAGAGIYLHQNLGKLGRRSIFLELGPQSAELLLQGGEPLLCGLAGMGGRRQLIEPEMQDALAKEIGRVVFLVIGRGQR